MFRRCTFSFQQTDRQTDRWVGWLAVIRVYGGPLAHLLACVIECFCVSTPSLIQFRFSFPSLLVRHQPFSVFFRFFFLFLPVCVCRVSPTAHLLTHSLSHSFSHSLPSSPILSYTLLLQLLSLSLSSFTTYYLLLTPHTTFFYQNNSPPPPLPF